MKNWDVAGLLLSGLCVVHCIAMPFVLLYLPLLGLEWLAGPHAHVCMLGFGVLIGGASFWPGYRQHRRLAIPLLAVCGLGTMAYAATMATAGAGECCTAACCGTNQPGQQAELGAVPVRLTPVGAALLLTAHGFNRRCRRSERCRAVCCVTRDAEV
jgi:hypothetical protein